MEEHEEKSFPDLLGSLKSWIPWRSDPTNVSRDFWMPDESCRVCYECDSHFSLFNRRHHCRHCGLVFCAKCTSNWIPSQLHSSKDDRRIRVCTFCFKQWEQQGLAALPSNLTSSPSETSVVSTKSSGTVDSTGLTFVSFPDSVGSSFQQNHSPVVSPTRFAAMERNADTERVIAQQSAIDYASDTRNQSSDQFQFRLNRTDDYNDEYGVYGVDTKGRHYPRVNGYYGLVDCDEVDNEYGSRKVHLSGEINDIRSDSVSSLHDNNFHPKGLEADQLLVKKEDEHYNAEECEAPSSMFATDVVEPVDFENNGLLWLPPEPEDEEDDKEDFPFDDDDEGVVSGEWGYLRSSSSFGNGEQRNRDRSNEEHRKAMKNVVDGHFRALVAQLLQVENISLGEEGDKESWLEIITWLCWEAATLLKPDTSKGGGMDPGGYVKIKCIASGHRSESMVVKGVVCKKNVAHRRMTSRIEKPRVLILGGALEYQRVSNLLSSFDTLLQQEMDHLRMAVAKIDAHQPDVLLVEKSVSRFAQEYLLEKDISLVLNIKRPLLERIARCTGAQILPSIDNLSSQKLGYCDMFHVERILEEHSSAGQAGKKSVKTLMYFEGCPKPLGCTILLRGSCVDELKKVKHVIQYGVFAAYHVALETSFLADEGASLPELPLNSPLTVALPDKPSFDRSISTISGFTVPVNEKTRGPQTLSEPSRFSSVPAPALFSSVPIVSPQQINAPISPSFPGAMNNQSLEPSSSFVDSPSSFSVFASLRNFSTDFCPIEPSYYRSTLEKTYAEIKGSHVTRDQLIVNESMNSEAGGDDLAGNVQNDYSAPSLSLVGNLEVSAMQQDANHQVDPSSSREEFPPSPSDHQSILVSLSSRCVWKGTVCERSHLFRIKYYGNFDKPLGRFLRDHLFDPSYRCRSCEMPSEAHVQCYTHRQGTLTISVKKLLDLPLPGEKEGKIWMWHRCLKCPRINGFPPATRRIVMSDAAWGLSFGKFLELSFSNHAAASRVASCGHSLHRDCLRFYGFGKMVACFRYASIDVHSVYLPPHQLDFSYGNRDWIQKEINEVVDRAELLFAEVLNALSQIVEKRSGTGSVNNSMKVPEARRRIAEFEAMLQKEKTEFEESLQNILSKDTKKDQPAVDVFVINRLRRQLVIRAYVWDQLLIFASISDSTQIQDDKSSSSSELIEKSLCVNGHPIISGSKSGSALSVSDSLPLELKPTERDEQDGFGNQGTTESNHRKESQLYPSVSMHSGIASEPSEATAAHRRTRSDGQFVNMLNLSDTLDAAWTGESHPGFGVSNADSSTLVDSSTDVAENKKHPGDDQSGHWSTIGSGIVEDPSSCAGIPSVKFYMSLNTKFQGISHKLDIVLGEYVPVFVSSFRELELQGGARFFLDAGVSNTVIPVYDDEPTSIIAYALVSPEYLDQMSDECEKVKDNGESSVLMQSIDSGSFQSIHSSDEMALDSYRSFGSTDDSSLSMSGSRGSFAMDPLSYTKALHVRVSFTDNGPLGKVKYTVTCYYAQRFEALRRICCPSETDFVRSLSRCKKWGAQGGKSNVFFAKTLDDRFIIKQVTKTELESFIKFAPGYFKHLSEAVGMGSPTCLAKVLGIYQVSAKHLKGGRESKMDVLVMENLLFGRNVTRLYDLKGSSRSRYNADSSGSNKVLLDQNLIEAMPTSPIFVSNKAKRLLERAVWNDTAFLATVDVMDYSLLVGVDEEKNELVLGIIDFMRQYTWDKHLETWVKTSGILGGPKNASPTVISPKQYKKRFRKAMTMYFLMIPDQWSPRLLFQASRKLIFVKITTLKVEQHL